jgi:hypothetical protein
MVHNADEARAALHIMMTEAQSDPPGDHAANTL